jgi:tetratricopeptide (TPR) repeat protein
MRRVILRLHLVVGLASASVLGAATLGCETPKAVEKKAAPVEAEKLDVDPAALCQVKAEIDDAASRLKLADLRTRLEKDAATDRAARFGALLSIQNEQDRFHAFHDDTEQNPKSGVGPLGECFVYAAWKMSDQAQGSCQMADDRLRGAAVVDVARAELLRRKGNLDEAQNLIDNALSTDNGCAAALIEAARVQQARGDAEKALASWERARAAWPTCYLCAVEAAKLAEASSGKDAAVPMWEAALALQPDSAEALKRYGAALAGVDNAKALSAYERAIDAGQNDVATFMGAAQLAGDNVDKGLAFAEKAAALQPNEIDAWRIILALAQKKPDAVKARKAAGEILRLVDEDVPALLVVARDARQNGQLVEAVTRFDAAARAIAGGRTGGLLAPDLEAARKEHAALLAELKVPEKAPKGNASAVVSAVQKTVQGLFVERLKKKKGMKGTLDVGVTVSAAGVVEDVEIVKDTLGDAAVTASVVANLRRATITGGAKRYSFTMDFQ